MKQHRRYYSMWPIGYCLAGSTRATGVLRTKFGVKFVTWHILYLWKSIWMDWQKL